MRQIKGVGERRLRCSLVFLGFLVFFCLFLFCCCFVVVVTQIKGVGWRAQAVSHLHYFWDCKCSCCFDAVVVVVKRALASTIFCLAVLDLLANRNAVLCPKVVYQN